MSAPLNSLNSLPEVTTTETLKAQAAEHSQPIPHCDTSSSICSLDEEEGSCLECFTNFFASCWNLISWIFTSLFCCCRSSMSEDEQAVADIKKVEAFIGEWEPRGLDSSQINLEDSIAAWKSGVQILPEAAFDHIKLAILRAFSDNKDVHWEERLDRLSNREAIVKVRALVEHPKQKMIVITALREWVDLQPFENVSQLVDPQE